MFSLCLTVFELGHWLLVFSCPQTQAGTYIISSPGSRTHTYTCAHIYIYIYTYAYTYTCASLLAHRHITQRHAYVPPPFQLSPWSLPQDRLPHLAWSVTQTPHLSLCLWPCLSNPFSPKAPEMRFLKPRSVHILLVPKKCLLNTCLTFLMWHGGGRGRLDEPHES